MKRWTEKKAERENRSGLHTDGQGSLKRKNELHQTIFKKADKALEHTTNFELSDYRTYQFMTVDL